MRQVLRGIILLSSPQIAILQCELFPIKFSAYLCTEFYYSQSATNTSLGHGIEKEVLFMLWQRFVQKRAQFFVECKEGFCTIWCLTSVAGASLSAVQKQEIRWFAVIAALLYINGHTPMPLSPAVILFIIYGTDLHCLTPAFIREWFVNLRKRLIDWITMGPEGDLQPFNAYFASFHDTEASFHLICYLLLAFNYFFRYLHIGSVTLLPIKHLLSRYCILQHLVQPRISTWVGQFYCCFWYSLQQWI